MNRLTTLFAAGALTAAAAVAPAAAQNLPPPGDVNPGSMQSGAEETGAPNQPRSYTPYTGGPAVTYEPGYTPGFDAYAAQPGVTYGPFTPYRPGYGPYGLGTGGAGAIGSDN